MSPLPGNAKAVGASKLSVRDCTFKEMPALSLLPPAVSESLLLLDEFVLLEWQEEKNERAHTPNKTRQREIFLLCSICIKFKKLTVLEVIEAV